MGPFESARLVYRAVEPAEDEEFFLQIQRDPLSFQNSNARIAAPQSREDAKRYMNHVASKVLLGVVICLPAADQDSKHVPIGAMHLDAIEPHLAHHRNTDIGIDILREYQGKGYGSEAINWVLQWAFQIAGLHRVGICAFGLKAEVVRRYGFKDNFGMMFNLVCSSMNGEQVMEQNLSG
ncbi:Putative GNAT domain, acyl-CoA N-acyltransferase [Septoria linicola]|uniref:GNAT domain, acyl-CoA N-acyltransferase n=1 Tax=Septoria linicola TaxID=215465 RepID=A0A9Q9AVA6_9PEZI|nr:putative GNAT domain, acyl-CoA N-acyltransferase [Septoria linicola]USW55509.1 Putative GNAT domain, acyl-CoA N-acyltransferase [Septoria linicola]